MEAPGSELAVDLNRSNRPIRSGLMLLEGATAWTDVAYGIGVAVRVASARISGTHVSLWHGGGRMRPW